MPLDATEADSCGVCLACAVVAYGDIARSFAIPLKCGRMVAVAQTITRYVASLIEQSGGATIPVPVPLNRTRLWQRGFNQSALVAKGAFEQARTAQRSKCAATAQADAAAQGYELAPAAQDGRGAFRVADKAKTAASTIIRIDDVQPPGSTAEACVRTLNAPVRRALN